MTIYGRFHNPVELVRWGTLDDVQKLDGRKPDKADRHAVADGCYLVVRNVDDGKESLHHQVYLRADGGAAEIAAVRDAMSRPFTDDDFAAARRGLELECRPAGAGDAWYPAVVTGRTQTRLHVDATGKVTCSYSLTRSDARNWLRWPAAAR